MRTDQWVSAASAAFVTVAAANVSFAQQVDSGTTDALIRGFAKFQASRVEKLVLNEFLSDLAERPLLKKFFPRTSAAVTTYNGATSAKRLIPLIQFYVNEDLDRLGDLATCLSPGNRGEVTKDPFKVRFSITPETVPPFVDTLLRFVQAFRGGDRTTAEILPEICGPQGDSAPTSVAALAPLRPEAEVMVELARRATDAYREAEEQKRQERRAKLTGQINGVPARNNALQCIEERDCWTSETLERKCGESCETVTRRERKCASVVRTGEYCVRQAKEQLDRQMLELEKSEAQPSQAEKDAADHDVYRKFIASLTAEKALLDGFTAQGIDLIGFIEALNRIWALRKSQHPPNPAAVACHDLPPMAAAIQQMLVAAEALGFDANLREFSRFKDQSLFLGSLVDAACTRDADAVAGAIDSYIDDQSALRSKRSEAAFVHSDSDVGSDRWFACGWRLMNCADTWFVASYYGLSLGQVVAGDALRGDLLPRFYGPVGIEFKAFSTSGWPIAIGVAPIDLGAYVTNELLERDYAAKLDDIKAPSYFLSFSVKGHAYSLMVGYQERVRVTQVTEEDLAFVAFAFDLPVLVLPGR